MTKRQSLKKPEKINPLIIPALIALIGTITAAILSSPLTLAILQDQPTYTPFVPTINANNPTLTPNPSSTPVQLPTATLSSNILIFETGNESPLDEVISYEPVWDVPPLDAALLELPDELNPELSPDNSLIQTIQSIKSNDYQNWNRVSPELRFRIDIENIQGLGGLDIIIQNKVKVVLYNYLPTKHHVHALTFFDEIIPNGVLIPVTGGSYNYSYSPFLLTSQDWKNREFISVLSEFDSIILKQGEAGTLDFLFQCQDPGNYLAYLTLQVFYAGKNYNVPFLAPNLICPESLTVWNYTSENNQSELAYKWKNLGDFVLENGGYKSIP